MPAAASNTYGLLVSEDHIYHATAFDGPADGHGPFVSWSRIDKSDLSASESLGPSRHEAFGAAQADGELFVRVKAGFEFREGPGAVVGLTPGNEPIAYAPEGSGSAIAVTDDALLFVFGGWLYTAPR